MGEGCPSCLLGIPANPGGGERGAEGAHGGLQMDATPPLGTCAVFSRTQHTQGKKQSPEPWGPSQDMATSRTAAANTGWAHFLLK